MGNDWITLPLSASRITSFCGLRPATNSRRCSRSIAKAVGCPAGATGQCDLIVSATESMATTVFFSLDLARHFQSRHIENNRLGGSAIADESFAKFFDQRYSMALFQSGDRSDHRAAISVGDLHFRTV